jgi:hypothetical protein
VSTRPDNTFAINLLPNLSVCRALIHLLNYVYATKERKLTFNGKATAIVGYSDSDWAGDPIQRKSTTGYVFFIGNCPISWQSKLQPLIALSSTEAEYIALSVATQEALWLRDILAEWTIKMRLPTTIFCDSNSAIKLAYNPVFHKRTKHIEIKFHFIRSHVAESRIVVAKIDTAKMIADVLTKNTPRRINELLHRSLMGGERIRPSSKRKAKA